MKTKIISLLLLIILTSCSFWSNNSDVVKTQESSTINQKLNDTQGTWWLSNSIEDKIRNEASSYSEIDSLEEKDRVIIKSSLLVNKNTLNNIISNCDFLEGKKEYIIENWEKVKEERKWLPDRIIYNLEKQNKPEELNDFKSLIAWKIEWKFKLFESNDLDETKFSDKKEFYSYFWKYIMLLKDEAKFDNYVDLYLYKLKSEEWELDENEFLPITAAYFYVKKSCNSFINKNFISY